MEGGTGQDTKAIAKTLAPTNTFVMKVQTGRCGLQEVSKWDKDGTMYSADSLPGQIEI